MDVRSRGLTSEKGDTYGISFWAAVRRASGALIHPPHDHRVVFLIDSTGPDFSPNRRHGRQRSAWPESAISRTQARNTTPSDRVPWPSAPQATRLERGHPPLRRHFRKSRGQLPRDRSGWTEDKGNTVSEPVRSIHDQCQCAIHRNSQQGGGATDPTLARK